MRALVSLQMQGMPRAFEAFPAFFIWRSGKKGLSALVYTQLTDVEDEVNGLFTYDRAEIKPDANAVRSVNAALAAEFAKVTR